VQKISLSGTEMSLVRQWDAVNGDVLRCPTVQAWMYHDHQLEHYSVSNVKPVELLVEQLTELPIIFACVASDVGVSIKHSL